MTDKTESTAKQKHISLAEYAWIHHNVNDLPMDKAATMKREAWKEEDKKVRNKKDIQTPLLRPSDWIKIWDKAMSHG